MPSVERRGRDRLWGRPSAMPKGHPAPARVLA